MSCLATENYGTCQIREIVWRIWLSRNELHRKFSFSQSNSMALSLSRILCGRHYLSSTVAVATATTILATFSSPHDGSAKDANEGMQCRRSFFEQSRQSIYLNHPALLFAYPQKSISFCEAPHSSLHPNVTYKPSDPAEPVADPSGDVDVTSSDGRKVHVKGGMSGAEQEGLVGHCKISISQLHPFTC